uniref:Cardiolipin synthase N-terminal domain-containing protein n=1 Tax=Thermosporothrix sp. COM3 TaxID=2490863 RepID=A0A455SUK8_9CHLR|nr:hypothetical protein KTC_60670 [Thermosporothrix sp. COM3]
MEIALFLLVALVVCAGVFWMWMLVDCLINETLNGRQRLGWLALVVFASIIGSIIYFIKARNIEKVKTSDFETKPKEPASKDRRETTQPVMQPASA